jgi:mannose-6-phosphate isomerase-like protein (cupin superfamily)
MARVFKQAEGKRLGLAGRNSLEIVSGERGSSASTVRLVEIPVPKPGDPSRNLHHHTDCEECIFVLSGRGTTRAESGDFPLEPGDTILIQPGEKHATHNTGNVPLMLLCFFPVPDIARTTRESSRPEHKD